MPVNNSVLGNNSAPVYLVDASIYIFRAYFSIPDRWFEPGGYPVNALYGYVQFWLKFLREAAPEKVVAAYDESLGGCFRNELYPDYKMSRVLPDETLAFQLQACKEFTGILGIASPASERYEADDILATLVEQARGRGEAVTIVSRDKDLGQLLKTERDIFWDFADDRRLDRAGITEKFGVRPEQLADYLALVGDSIDDVPGVPGVGPKTAAALLQRFGTINALYDGLEQVAQCDIRGARSLASKLEIYREQLSVTRQLVTLHTRVPLDRKTRSMRWLPPSVETVRCFLDEFGLGEVFARQLERCDCWS